MLWGDIRVHVVVHPLQRMIRSFSLSESDCRGEPWFSSKNRSDYVEESCKLISCGRILVCVVVLGCHVAVIDHNE